MEELAAFDVGESIAAVLGAKRGALLAEPPLWLSLRRGQHEQVLLVGLEGLWQLLRHFQQLVVLVLQLLLHVHLPYTVQQYLYLFLAVGSETIEDVILLLSVYLGLKSPEQLGDVLVLLHPGQNPK